MKFFAPLLPLALTLAASSSAMASPNLVEGKTPASRGLSVRDDGCAYASVAHINDVWDNLFDNNWGGFFNNFVEDIDWTVMYTQPLAGHYDNLTLFIVNGVIRLLDTFDGNANFTLVNIVGGCDDPWSVQETLVEGKCKNGLIVDEIVVWATRWNAEGKIVQVRSYVDSYITTMAIHGNEIWSNSSWRVDRDYFIPGPSGFPNLTAYLGYVIPPSDQNSTTNSTSKFK